MTKTKSVLITGVNGFAGRWTARNLSENGFRITGLLQRELEKDDPLLKLLDGQIICDLSQGATETKDRFDYILHLASLTPHWARRHNLEPGEFQETNDAISDNAVKIIRQIAPVRALIVSSNAVYSSQSRPIVETDEIAPKDVYGLSKVHLEKQAGLLRDEGLDVLIARPFNHIGPEQPEGFFVPDMVKKISGSPDGKITVGNISTVRDYVDVRDIAEAYRLLLLSDKLEDTVFNVSTGESATGKDILKIISNLMDKPVYPQSSEVPGKFNNPNVSVGDNTRLRRQTGWARRYSLNDSIKDYLALRFS